MANRKKMIKPIQIESLRVAETDGNEAGKVVFLTDGILNNDEEERFVAIATIQNRMYDSSYWAEMKLNYPASSVEDAFAVFNRLMEELEKLK